MEKTEYKNIFDNERTHFYYVGTHNAVITLLNLYLKELIFITSVRITL